jgi:hypothetical protein
MKQIFLPTVEMSLQDFTVTKNVTWRHSLSQQYKGDVEMEERQAAAARNGVFSKHSRHR